MSILLDQGVVERNFCESYSDDFRVPDTDADPQIVFSIIFPGNCWKKRRLTRTTRITAF